MKALAAAVLLLVASLWAATPAVQAPVPQNITIVVGVEDGPKPVAFTQSWQHNAAMVQLVVWRIPGESVLSHQQRADRLKVQARNAFP